jgi:4-carboxymuconolactone decarboxylase
MTDSGAERLPRLTPAELTPEQRAVYDGITAGPRASGKQLFALTDENGALTGPFGVMLHAPGVGVPLQDLGAAIRYRTSLSARSREIAILMVAAALDSEFERYAHERVGASVGLSEDELAALRRGSFRSDDPVEDAVGRLSTQLLAGEPVDDESYESYAAALDAQAIVEVVVLVGYYRLLAQSMDVFAVGAPTE